VLEYYKVSATRDQDRVWRNLVNMYRRFNTRELTNAHVRADLNGRAYDVATDEDGYFTFDLALDEPLYPTDSWQTVALHLPDYPDDASAQHLGRILIPASTAQFGVISDIDDTILKTDVLNVVKMAQNTFLRNARTRLPFAGVAEFYKALHEGVNQGADQGESANNPIYYVSNSVWNLYDLLLDFFEVRGLPLGPMFLLDLVLNETYLENLKLGTHKRDSIRHLLDLYPNLPFILIGDSGEHDPEIYLEAVLQHPGRILAVYIRDAWAAESNNKKKHQAERTQQTAAIIEQCRAAGTEMLLVPDTLAAAQHAAAQGYIAADKLSAIRAARTEDNRSAPMLDSAPAYVVPKQS
jgi:phosphatidate phosphatase APP1